VLIPQAEWELKKRKGIILFSEDWAKVKISLLKNCINSDQCKQAVGALDELFIALDEALRLLPKYKPN
jgi:hypothetical protein